MEYARNIVRNKINNQIAVIKKHRWSGIEYNWKVDVSDMKKLEASLQQKKTNQEIMGVEGMCSNIYFRCFRYMLKCEINFDGRNRRPPKDPVNAILSLAYTFLTKDMCTLIDSESFESYLGFLHGIRYGRKSLALDLIEEWRQPAVDRLVLLLFNKHILTKYDFSDDEGDGIVLNEDGFRKFCLEYERWMNGNNCNGKSFRTMMKQQVAVLKKSLENGEIYKPYFYGEKI